MRITRHTLADVADAAGVVIVIDVLRAFSTAAFALARGATEVVCVAAVDEALAERERRPGSLAMGEVGGRPVAGFDLDNSPTHMASADVAGRVLVQRTTAGTQGVVGAAGRAEALFAASFVCAEATVRAVVSLAPAHVALVATGVDHRDGEEDRACGDYLAARLLGETPHPDPYLARVRASDAAQAFTAGDAHFPASDLDLATDLDAVDVALAADLGGRHPTLRPVRSPHLLPRH